MESIKYGGAELISRLQLASNASDHAVAGAVHRSLWYASPQFVLTVLCPLLLALQGTSLGGFHFPRRMGLAALWTAITCLRVNVFKQWLTLEDRPYWWGAHSSRQVPRLLQFPVTCLTTPSAPVHVLMATGVGAVLASCVATNLRVRAAKQGGGAWLGVAGVWLSHMAVVAAVAAAECLFSQHFPHQVADAAVVGLAVWLAVSASDLTKRQTLPQVAVRNGLVLAATLAMMYYGGALANFNQFHTKAFRWCRDRHWLQVDPLPLLDALMWTSYAVGATIATGSRLFRDTTKARFTGKMALTLAALQLLTTQALLLLQDAAPLLSPHAASRYVCACVAAAGVSFCCVALLPYFVQRAASIRVEA